MSIQLGPFLLTSQLGRGGMGEVWAGTHVDSGQAVAVKFLTRGLRHSSFRRQFSAEVRAAASLQHPSIVRVFDAGTTPVGFSGLTEGQIPGEAPFLVMERATGTLAEVLPELQWNTLMGALLRLLDGLAFVHACGWVHRDVKPLNVLLGCRRDPLERLEPIVGGLRLADFGIVWNDARDAGWASSGTESMMAPEQRDGRWADFGPWTDLYAVGRIAESWSQAGHPAPADLASWVHRMTRSHPHARPDRAAVAAAELRNLGPATVVVQASPAMDDIPTEAVFTPLSSMSTQDPLATRVTVLPAPARWSAPRAVWPSVPIAAAGLGLQQHRASYPAGRQAIRQELWEDFRTVVDGGVARRRTLVGPKGSGRQHLAEWVARFAHACGTAEVLRLRPEALSDALTALLGIAGLDVQTARTHLQTRWDVDWSASAAEWLCHPSLHVPTGALANLVERVAAHRPVVVVATELVPGSPESLLCERLEVSSSPILVLSTGREGEDSIPPLPDGEMEEVLRAWLPFTPASLGRLLDHAAGNPGRAFQALQRGASGLVWTPLGFEWTFDPGQTAFAWVEQALTGMTDVERSAVHLAAVREAPINGSVWRELAPAALQVLPELLERGIAVMLDEEDWLFVDDLQRVVLDSMSSEELVACHEWWVDVDVAREDWRRAGHHLLAAGQRERGASYVLQAAREARMAGRTRLAERTLQPLLVDEGTWDRANGDAMALWLQGSDHPVGLRRERSKRLLQRSQEHGWIDLEASAMAEIGLLDDVPSSEGIPHLERALKRALAGNAQAVARRIQGGLAMLLINSGQQKRAESVAAGFVESAERDEVREAMIWAWLHHSGGRSDLAREHARLQIRLARKQGRAYEVSGWHVLAAIEFRSGRLKEGREACDRGMALLRHVPHQRDELRLRETLAGIHFKAARYAESRSELTRTLALYRELGRRPDIPLVSLGVLEARVEAWEGLARVNKAIQSELLERPLGRFAAACFGALLARHASDMDEAGVCLDAALGVYEEVRPSPMHRFVLDRVLAVSWDGHGARLAALREGCA